MSAEMRTFEYQARDQAGKLVKGRIEAAHQGAVAGRLRTMGIAPLEINEVSTTGLNREIKLGFGSGVKTKDLAVMARQLATMVSAGLSLLRALSILTDQTDNKVLAKTLGQVRAGVETGQSLSAAMEKHPTIFPPLMLNMIRAGEVGGFLEEVLISIANNFEAEVKLRGKIKSAMTYPVVVFVIAILAVVGMLMFIVPVFANMFTEMGAELPLPTQILVVGSNIMKWAALPLLVVVIAAGLWWGKHKNDLAVRERLDPLKLRVPVFGSLFKKVAIARFSRNFGTMVRAGVPLLQALDIVGETAGNVAITHAVKDVRDSVRSGMSLSAPLAQHSVFPSMVVQMMAVGEDTGALDTMLDKIADFYDEEVEATTEQLTSLIEPIMIVTIGGIIGAMIVALYMPIFDIYNQIS
ncbi:type II secretion system F family protein [Cellulomonas denverensis]|uniref:Type II secretion system F family protein n=2 Tax=Cellulomonas denverensis TaxID=264297 RepID=A0A7X6QYD0_9CELL|nr:type II secretion system F family protein [Cellulomonas denverensis]NKY21866.1 type II secretion system F family protein [Cellulomonas denverensis]GIG24245.1 type II secretion system protein F [Cellulomonas denverensis]